MHSASLRCGLAAILEDVPLEEMRPGDVYASNDPFRGGIHANDIMVLRPIFADGRVRWFGGTLIHVADMGGTAVGGLGALATSTYDEGVLLPTVRLYEEGRPNRDVLSIVARNSRTPANASAAPAAPPVNARTRLSVKRDLTSWTLLAPSAARTAVSRSALMARASCRLARLTQAINSTAPTAANNNQSAPLMPEATSFVRGVRAIPK